MKDTTARADVRTTADAVPGRAPRADAAGPEAAPAIDAAGRAVLRHGSLLALQRSAGNQAVGRLLRRRGPRASATGSGTPTVQRLMTNEQATQIARRLLGAMDRWGTDEEAIYGALSGRSRADLDAIVAAYQPMAMHGSLDADLRDELTESEMARVTGLMSSAEADDAAVTPDQVAGARTARARDVARQLDEAMRGLGTDEEQLLNSLMGRSPYDVVEIAREYQRLTGKALVDEIRSELSGADLATALGLYRTMHNEGDGPNDDIAMLQQALNANGAAPALRITAVFGPETTAALQQFQTSHAPLVSDGRATVETWLKLDELTPQVFREGRMVVEGPRPAESRGTPTTGTVHPTLQFGARGDAVEELQQKLLTVDATQVPTRPTVNRKFDAATRSAVREFQGSRTPPLTVNGRANTATWTALDAVAGPVTVGREEFEWAERVEGEYAVGTTRFTWRLHPDKFEVTVNIRFTGAPAHPMVTQWRNDIRTVWNRFKLIDDDHPGTSLNLEFVPGTGTPADATVQVHVTPAGAAAGRSDAGNFHTGDTRQGLAPHEFGHLIGLMDEYNQGPEQETIVTGEQPFTGAIDAPVDASGAQVQPATIAGEIRAAVTSSPAGQRGNKARNVVVTKYGLTQGAFSQRVAVAYETANAGNMLRSDWNATQGTHNVADTPGTIANDMSARIPGWTSPETDAVEPFLYSNRSLMGTMDSLANPVNEHDHPIAERHVRHFARLVARNRPGNWRVAPR
jgi:peptidoglycan hydrolase-like protein with peptidoglycan-binding domain